MMNEHEQKIKDLRTLEAKKRDYMGLKGKFGIILKALGEPIVRQTSGNGGLFTQTHVDDYWYDIDDEGLPTADMEDRNQPDGWEWSEPREVDLFDQINEGWHFDGLNRGFPLEIWFKEDESELKVLYQGQTVYREQAGDLKSFVPLVEWQNMIEGLYVIARQKAKIQQTEKSKQQIEAKKAAQSTWFQKMKKLWGI